MKILVTGAAGFIGFFVVKSLLTKGYTVVGLDNINDYYDVGLKFARLEQLGVAQKDAEQWNKETNSNTHTSFSFIRMALEERKNLPELCKKHCFDTICNLAAQAGVRYSIENPEAYVDSNLVGFLNILECCRNYDIRHLVYASSSSVYGLNEKIPFETTDSVNHPVSLYAATKKSNELMAHAYSHLYGFKSTGLRFFTVYGPWGRPDMAMFLFTDAIMNNKPIKVFNNGKLERDFTYIEDITEGVVRILETTLKENRSSKKVYSVYNIGNSKSVKLMDFITAIEESVGKVAQKEMLPMQPGDVEKTWANVDDLIRDYNYSPNTPIKLGVQRFVEWYRSYYAL